jgi:hypothetical protein
MAKRFEDGRFLRLDAMLCAPNDCLTRETRDAKPACRDLHAPLERASECGQFAVPHRPNRAIGTINRGLLVENGLNLEFIISFGNKGSLALRPRQGRNRRTTCRRNILKELNFALVVDVRAKHDAREFVEVTSCVQEQRTSAPRIGGAHRAGSVSEFPGIHSIGLPNAEIHPTRSFRNVRSRFATGAF